MWLVFFFTRFYYVEVVTENHAKGSFDPWLLYQFDVEQSWKLATQNNLGSSLIRNNYPVGKDPLKVSNKGLNNVFYFFDIWLWTSICPLGNIGSETAVFEKCFRIVFLELLKVSKKNVNEKSLFVLLDS